MEAPPATTLPPSRTVLGPLSTTFTPPASCATARVVDSIGTSTWLTIGATCKRDAPNSAGLGLDEKCYPKGLNDRLTLGRGPAGQVYSPGRVCPAGYTPACTVTRDDRPATTTGDFNRADLDVWSYLSTGETAEGCCPTGYTCNDQSSSLCQTSVAPTTSFGAMFHPSGDCNFGIAQFYTVTDTSRSIYIDARRVVLVHRATEEEDQQFAPPPEQHSKGLSAGAIAGIVVGACAIVAVALFASFCIFKRRRRRHQSAKGGGSSVMVNPGQPAPASTASKPELQGTVGVYPTEMSGVGMMQPELQSTFESDRHHLKSPTAASELSGGFGGESPGVRNVRYELQGSHLSDPSARSN